MTKPIKSLEQIAYEATIKSRSWDPPTAWADLPPSCRTDYVKIAKAVAQEIERRRKEKENEQ